MNNNKARKLIKENLLGTLGGSGIGALLGYIKSKGQAPKGFEDFENPAKAAELDAIRKGKEYITIDPETGNPSKVPAEISKILQPDIQAQYDKYQGAKKAQNIKYAGTGAGLGGVGGFLTTRKKKKKKDESKVSRKQLIELIEKAQVDEALPALAALKPAAAAIAGAAARYGPTIWKGLKGLGSYFVVDKGLDYLAGDDEPKKNKPVDPETKTKIDQNLGKEIQKQQDLSKRGDTLANFKTKTIEPKYDFVKTQTAQDRIDSLKNLYKIGN